MSTKNSNEFAWRSKYSDSKVPVDKFRDEKSYLAFVEANDKGLIKVKGEPSTEQNKSE